jgi:(p)ppGpp synthase/HD superfamily hydrolase
MKLLSEQKIQCNGVEAKLSKEGYADVRILVMMRNKDEILELNRKLRKISGVFDISRFSKRQKLR